MPRIIFNEYRDQYENTNYPFADNATLTDSSGEIAIPQNTFLDAGFYFTNGFPYLSNITVKDNTISLTITSNNEKATCQFRNDEIQDVLNFKNDSGRFIGCIVSEKPRLGWFVNLPSGSYDFYPESTAFATRCNLPFQIRGVATMGVGDKSLWGDVWLVGGKGCFIRYMGDTDSGQHIIRIDNLGEVLYKRAQCENELPTPNYLLTINGVHPDEYGNVNIAIQGDTRLRLLTTKNGLEIIRI